MATATESDNRGSRPASPPGEGSLTIAPEDYSLLSDLYELTMAACYCGEGLDDRPASFELFVRKLPKNFGYLIAMGLAQAFEYLHNFRFTPEQISSLQSTGIFAKVSDKFWSTLENARFTGDVWALPEGTAVFPNEPLLRVEAPFWQAQVVETYLLNTLNYQTLVGTRAARIRDVAGPSATILEFGTRRAFSPQGSMWGARSAIAGGMNSTSNVLAALKLGRKPSGTMAHSLVMALTATEGSEMQAFRAFHHYFPGAPLLIDTYDTVEAARQLADRLLDGDMEVAGVRIDSGDLAKLSKQVKELLPDARIFVSGDLDEWEIAKLKAENCPIDGYGVGTKLVTGSPVNGVYKIVEIDGMPVMKKSSGKVTYPGRKQIFRRYEGGKQVGDRLGLASEEPQPGETPMLQLLYRKGKPVHSPDTLEAIGDRTQNTVASLPDSARQLDDPTPPPVEISESLQALTQKTQEKYNLL
ncbi:nicotinate phosphoribosyltransferase [Phormidium sp. CCY1219]|uniref:nicotinate phosphoribosyltransferase n=1 Tax=Phormidium sp. CCY1219 TaxID=2886104 RepID=UPI002D1EF0CD|nr:nicotinate phosphoribosyltransferase [Phormidium sp. CCY1219]MEB3828789.1 nicotinate phosphoribosyltransferase [Phormidium sp. CCY1219]